MTVAPQPSLLLERRMKTEIEQFFRDFEANDNAEHIDAIVAQFADTFLFAGPDGSQAVRTHDFARALPKRKQFFKQLGCISTELQSVAPVKLGERYVLASTRWRMLFQQESKPEEQITVESTFLVDMGGPVAKIVFYLPHHDVMALLQEKGLLANTGNG